MARRLQRSLGPVESLDKGQWTGDPEALRAWCADLSPPFPGGVVSCVLLIETLEGEMTANVGDWIIRGVKGEFYPCKPDIFAATYEAA